MPINRNRLLKIIYLFSVSLKNKPGDACRMTDSVTWKPCQPCLFFNRIKHEGCKSCFSKFKFQNSNFRFDFILLY